MKNKIYNLLFLLAILFQLPNYSLAAIDFANGKWETTFNCAEQDTGSTIICDDLGIGGSPAVGMPPTEITTSANNSSGKGGRGARFWVSTGTNIGSQPLGVLFPSPQAELWIRFYVRYDLALLWETIYPHYEKLLYIYSGGPGEPIFGQEGDHLRVYIQSISGAYGAYQMSSDGVAAHGSKTTMTYGWYNLSDGLWHSIELYMKMDTDSFDGVARIWFDGVLAAESTGMNFSDDNATTRQGWVRFHFKSNQNRISSLGNNYVDYDDMVIYNQIPPNIDAYGNAFIGPIGWANEGDAVPPTAPTNLSVR